MLCYSAMVVAGNEDVSFFYPLSCIPVFNKF